MSENVKEINREILRTTQSVVVYKQEYSKFGGFDGYKEIYTMDIAKALHNAGYRKHTEGEWIAVPSSDMSTGKAYKCSECQKFRFGSRLPPYCQECGAKMKG